MWHPGNPPRRPPVSPGRGATPLSYRTLLRTYRLGGLLLAAAMARLAERMLSLVLVLYALERFHSLLLAGWVGFAATAPGLLVSPLAGALLDRIGGASAIAADMGVSSICLLALAAQALAHADSPAALLVLVALSSLSNPLSAAGVRTLLPSLVPPAALPRANALDTSLHAFADIGGPAAAGAMVGFAGAAPALLLPALLYAAAGALLLPAAAAAGWPARAVRRTLLADAIAGMSYVLRHRSLRSLAAGYALYQLAWGILLVGVPVAVARSSGGTGHAATMVGAFWTIAGVASAAGALLAGRWSHPGRERGVMTVCLLATALALLGAQRGLAGLATALALTGLLAGPIDVALLTLRQQRSDPALLGRVIAVSMSLNLSGLPLGSALGGVLLAWSIPAAFAVAAAACAAAAVAVRFVPPR